MKITEEELEVVDKFEKQFDPMIREKYDPDRGRALIYLKEFPGLNRREMIEVERRYAEAGWNIEMGGDQRDGDWVNFVRKDREENSQRRPYTQISP